MKVKLFFYDFLLPYQSVNPVELDLVLTLVRPADENPVLESGKLADRASLGGIGFDVFAGVVFRFHAYTLPQITEKARDFFAIMQIIFVDNYPPLFLKKIHTSVWAFGRWGLFLKLYNY